MNFWCEFWRTQIRRIYSDGWWWTVGIRVRTWSSNLQIVEKEKLQLKYSVSYTYYIQLSFIQILSVFLSMRREADSRRNKPYITLIAQLLSDESEVAKCNILFTISSRNSVQHKKSIQYKWFMFSVLTLDKLQVSCL